MRNKMLINSNYSKKGVVVVVQKRSLLISIKPRFNLIYKFYKSTLEDKLKSDRSIILYRTTSQPSSLLSEEINLSQVSFIYLIPLLFSLTFRPCKINYLFLIPVRPNFIKMPSTVHNF